MIVLSHTFLQMSVITLCWQLLLDIISQLTMSCTRITLL